MQKYCSNCGSKINEDAYICVKCGVVVENNNKSNNVTNIRKDSGSNWYGVLGFFIPLAGLIIYICLKDTEPKSAKKAGKGALISVIVGVIIYSIIMILLGVLFRYEIGLV